ncbi:MULTISPECIES: hypothetical protein [unclassified Arthrobacter]|uniref:hypothetical protein n=1 Tax=unclassified Arthrobacter TaxID=235627 RepID=UPI0011B02966|nr:MULTISPECIES: hypothetical protein [unclassified Arthrobacter]
MFKKRVVMLCSGVLVGTLLVAAPSSALAAESPTVPSVAVGQPKSVALDLTSNRFEDCPTTNIEAPKASKLGDNLGPGITEEFDTATLVVINKSRIAAGEPAFGVNVKAMRYFDSGRIATLSAKGTIIEEVSPAYSNTQNLVSSTIAQPAGWLHPEVKRIITACLGVGSHGAATFELFLQELATPKNAAKFVIRRLGVLGAISCAGGIIWEYL